MADKLDIVALKWVGGLMNQQAEMAESALLAYGHDPVDKSALVRCMGSVHQITSTLRALGMNRGEILALEMERSLSAIYKDQLAGERRKLAMGGLMQALKVLPAYIAHTQDSREDRGQGLEPHVNDLRRWLGQRPCPRAYFFHMDIPPAAGISEGAAPASDEQVKNRANVMLAPYLEMAKAGLRCSHVLESMKTVARVARKMQVLFAGTVVERFWFTLVGLCEGIAGGLIVPDECIAQIFKTGAFLIKYARENGNRVDPSVDFEETQQRMLFYIASCRSKPLHIGRIRQAFGIDERTIETTGRNLVHVDAVITALSGAMRQLDTVVEYFNGHDLYKAGKEGEESHDDTALNGMEEAVYRLDAVGQEAHAGALRRARTTLGDLYKGLHRESAEHHERAINQIIRAIVDVKLDIEHKLRHGLSSTFSSKEYELRESVVTATFRQMKLVEDHLHQMLRRKALAAALARKPFCEDSLQRLDEALNRHLNKSGDGHEELRQAIQDTRAGDRDLDLLYRLSRELLDELEVVPDRRAIELSLDLLTHISGALLFAGMECEGEIIAQCTRWLEAASKGGSVREDDAFRCFADVFALTELHLRRSLIDPLDDTSQLLAYARERAAELDGWAGRVSSGADALDTAHPEAAVTVCDTPIPPEIREVFIDETEELVSELERLAEIWLADPGVNPVLRDIRRHFHTFKGNGRAVGANVLGELGWAAQDMLDRVLDGENAPHAGLQALLSEVIAALPSLLAVYSGSEGGERDTSNLRTLTARCFEMANNGNAEQAATVLRAQPRPQARSHTDSVVQEESLSHLA